jgi:hypothetical protein
MRRFTLSLVLCSLVAVPFTASALNVGTDVVVPAGARGAGQADSTWLTDLFIMNPGSATVNVTLYWMVRNQANPEPASETFTILAGETLVLEDVILSTFGEESAGGAFRVVADGDVVVNTRIFNRKGTVTFGQGFEGVPVAAAVTAGDSTDVVGLAHNDSFRTNLVLMDASGSGSSVDLSVRDTSGTELASATYDLGAWEPRLFPVTFIDAGLTFDNATLHAEVTSGAAVVVASKVDNDPDTGDPTTLEMWTPLGGGGSIDGTYRFAVYDSQSWAAGGDLTVSGGEVSDLDGTYFNWDKDEDSDGIEDCPLIFKWGGPLSPPVTVDDFAQGVSWTEAYPESGEITWTVTFTIEDNMSVIGTVDAMGSNFPSDPDPSLDQSGCNGTFPPLDLLGGKTE